MRLILALMASIVLSFGCATSPGADQSMEELVAAAKRNAVIDQPVVKDVYHQKLNGLAGLATRNGEFFEFYFLPQHHGFEGKGDTIAYAVGQFLAGFADGGFDSKLTAADTRWRVVGEGRSQGRSFRIDYTILADSGLGGWSIISAIEGLPVGMAASLDRQLFIAVSNYVAG